MSIGSQSGRIDLVDDRTPFTPTTAVRWKQISPPFQVAGMAASDASSGW